MENLSKPQAKMTLCICNAPLNSGKAVATLDFISTLQKPFKISASKNRVLVLRTF